MMKAHILLSLVIACPLLFSACRSHKKQVIENGMYEESHAIHEKHSDLGEKLGIDISGDDDIDLYKAVAEWIGIPYKYGGNTKSGVDCSGFVVNIYHDVYGKKLYRSSSDILSKNCRRISKKGLRSGDLVFFATGKNRNRINHVGIYLKNGKFIHASSSKGVIVSDISTNYYMRTYVASGRVI